MEMSDRFHEESGLYLRDADGHWHHLSELAREAAEYAREWNISAARAAWTILNQEGRFDEVEVDDYIYVIEFAQWVLDAQNWVS